MWRLPTKVLFAEGETVRQLPRVINNLHQGCQNALLVTDNGVCRNTQWIKQIFDEFNENHPDCRLHLFTDVAANPHINSVYEITQQLEDTDSSVIIGMGGGSVIDAAKASAMYLTNKYSKPLNSNATNANNNNDDATAATATPLTDFIGKNLFPNEPLPFIAIPTTCGTGSEVTWVSVLTNDENEDSTNQEIDLEEKEKEKGILNMETRAKISIKGDGMFANYAIIDSDLLYSLPTDMIANTSMDALTHSIEAYLTNDDVNNEISNIFAIESINLIFQYLPRAVYKIKTDRFSRYNIMNASLYGGMAFGNSDVGSVHCLSETIGAITNLPHGLLNASILVPMLKYYVLIEKNHEIINKLRVLCRSLNLSKIMLYNMLIKEKGNEYISNLSYDLLFIELVDRLRSEVKIETLKSLDLFDDKKNNGLNWEYIAQMCEKNNSNPSNIIKMTSKSYLNVIEMLKNDEIVYIKNPCHDHD